MKKRIISMLLVCVLVLSLLPTLAFAMGTETNTATISAFNAAGAQVGTTYATIDSAAAAAGVNGTVRISAGDYYFNGRQTVSVAGVSLEGAGKTATRLYASSAFASASATNKKALLTIAADNVTVKDLTLDGSPYGDSIAQSEDFVVLRNNSGTGIVLNNIMVEGSKRTLITVGMSSTSASVTGTNLYCQAEWKSLVDGVTYSDVNVVNGTFSLDSGAVNGFICTDSGNGYSGTLYNNTTNHYTLRQYVGGIGTSNYLTSTVYQFVNAYTYSSMGLIEKRIYVGSINNNLSVVGNMVNAASSESSTTISNFVALLTDARNMTYDTSVKATLKGYINTLNGYLGN